MRIFNRIRQKLLNDHKIRSYFVYALGEIVLIVVGILAALQINNWNEHKKDLRQEQIVLLNLQESFESNKLLIELSLVQLKNNSDNLMLRILNTGPNVERPSEFIIKSLSHIDEETLVLAYDGTNRFVSQDQLSLIRSDELRMELSSFTLVSTKYRSLESNVRDLTLDLRKIHQEYISILSQEIHSGRKDAIITSQEQFPSDYLGWLRNRNHQNIAVESKWILENSIVALNELKAMNQIILKLLKEQIHNLKPPE